MEIFRSERQRLPHGTSTATGPQHGAAFGEGGNPTARFAWFTFFLLCLNAFIERGVEQALPALFPHLEAGLGMSPTQLAALPFVRGFCQAAAALLGGWAAQKYHRGWICGLGCLLYGVCTMYVGLMEDELWFMGYPLMVLTAVGLSLIIPGSYSLILTLLSESQIPDMNGFAFGTHYLFGAVGCGLVSLLAFMFGYAPGWRIVLLFIGVITILLGVVDILFVHDPRPSAAFGTQLTWQSFRQVFRCKTMIWIICQGIVGQIPYNCLVFNSLFLNSLPITHFQVSWILFTFWAGTGAGGTIGGKIADWAANERRFPRYHMYGRVFVTQISLLISIALGLTMYKFLPSHSFASLMSISCVLGFFSSWIGPACTFPIIADVIAENNHSFGYAFDRCFESFIGTCFPLVFALNLERLGYKGAELFPTEADEELNAKHMGHIMAVIMCIGWGGCCVILSGLYWQYPKDSIRLREMSNQEECSPVSGNIPLFGDWASDRFDQTQNSPPAFPRAEFPQIPERGSFFSWCLPKMSVPGL